MNKAFVREREDSGQRHCPRCGSLGVAVGPETLAAHLPAEALRQLAESAFFCPFANCDVAYFDAFDRVAITDALICKVYPKDADAPLCGCFGFTRDDVEQDIREGGVRRVRQLLEKAKSPAAECLIRSASGQSCVSQVQSYYMKLKSK